MDRTPTEWMITPLRRYAQFGGRARRAEYWWFVLFGLIVSVAASVIDFALGLRTLGLGTVVSLVLLVPQLAVGFRRLHDLDRSGWWLLGPVVAAMALGGLVGVRLATGTGGGSPLLLGGLAVVLLVYSLVMLVWFCQRGTAGDNRYGPDPIAGIS